MNPVKKSILLAQAAWAARTVHLLEEPPGERSGLVRAPVADASGPSGAVGASGAADDRAGLEPIRLFAIGDSLVAGSGVADQSSALTPLIAGLLATRTGRDVSWETRAKLGSTMRRVRHRFLPEVAGRVDLLVVCAGSNDIMARRTRADWIEDFTAVADGALSRADHVIAVSSGQPHHSPKLPAMLRAELAKRIDAQTEDSMRICAERGIDYVDVAHAPLVEGFWASDGFHPSQVGYEYAAGLVVEALTCVDALGVARVG